MPTRDTPPPPTVEALETADLLEELGLALRDVGNWASSLPEDPRACRHVARVQAAHAELMRRGHDLGTALAALTEQTGWLMAQLLDNCLRYAGADAGRSAIAPAVRDLDGVRHWYRCPRCQLAEIPDKEGIWLCEGCVAAAVSAVRERVPLEGLLVFRSYTPEKWCRHADAETVLVAGEEYDGIGPCYCARCLADELARRAAAAGARDAPVG